MIIETPFHAESGMKYGYDLVQDPRLGWQAKFGPGILHEDAHVDLKTAIEAMIADSAQIAVSTVIAICLETVRNAHTIEGAVEALKREMPPERTVQ